MADMLDADSVNLQKHKEYRPSQVRKSKTAGNEVILAFQSLINPFKVENEAKVHSIASSAAASDEIATEVLNAKEIGKAAKEDSLKKGLSKM